MKRTHVLKLVVGGVLALGVGFAGGSAVAAVPGLFAPVGLDAADGVVTTPMPEPTYATNAVGETFGSAADARSPEEEPELIRAEATNGKVGYVRKAELDVADGTSAMATFTSPEDAVKWQAANLGISHAIPVYLVDGITVIGEFVVDAGVSSSR